jgi:hypothetical protein
MINLNPISFDNFIRDLAPFNKDTIELDLTEVNFISPAALTQLSALCHAFHKEKKKITVKLNVEIGSYLVRSGFVRSIRSVAKVEPEEIANDSYYENLRGTNSLLIEVTKMKYLAYLPRLLDRIVSVLHTKLEYTKNEAFDIGSALSEICQNIHDHNDGIMGFIAMQVYTKGKNKFLEIGVSDFGQGLAATLKRNEKNPGLRSNYEAIEFATKAGTSEFNDPTRGKGLYHLLRIIYKHSGLVQIHSGDGKVRYRKDRRTKWDGTVPNLPGVHIVLELRVKKYFEKRLDRV